MNRAARLMELYRQQSKHAGYQLLPPRLREHLGTEVPGVKSRQEAARWRFICGALAFHGRRVVDLGANVGYFSFAALDHGARAVSVVEGNPAMAEFVDLAGQVLGVSDRIAVHCGYFDPAAPLLPDRADIVLLLNVLHHLGDDFGDSSLSMDVAKAQMAQGIRNLSGKSKYLVLQIGYCWKGNREMMLFPGGSKQAQIDFVCQAADGYWRIADVGIAQPAHNGEIEYERASPRNLVRDDALGEFLNRPLFILEALDGAADEG